MLYDIQPYSFKIAKKLNLVLKPSRDNKHKIDIYDNDDKKNYIYWSDWDE